MISEDVMYEEIDGGDQKENDDTENEAYEHRLAQEEKGILKILDGEWILGGGSYSESEDASAQDSQRIDGGPLLVPNDFVIKLGGSHFKDHGEARQEEIKTNDDQQDPSRSAGVDFLKAQSQGKFGNRVIGFDDSA